MNATTDLPRSQSDTARAFIVAWLFSLAFYFLEYAMRSSPAVMIPQLAKAFGVSALGAEPDYSSYTVAPGGVQPHRVEDPVLWLLSKSGTVPTA